MPTKKAVKASSSSHVWTKKEMLLIPELWDSKSTSEIAEILHVKPVQVSYIASMMRKAGYPIPLKRRNGYLLNLIKELASEKGIKLSPRK